MDLSISNASRQFAASNTLIEVILVNLLNKLTGMPSSSICGYDVMWCEHDIFGSYPTVNIIFLSGRGFFGIF